MEKILLPIDGSDRSLLSIRKLKKDYKPEEVEVTLLTVVDSALHFKYDSEYEMYRQKRLRELDALAASLEGYKVNTVVLQGSPASHIVEYAENNKFDVLIMTRSSRGTLEKMGSVASQIVRKAPFLDLVILREDKHAIQEGDGAHETHAM